MPFLSHQIRQIQSLQPAVDHRTIDEVFILSGRNFAWDAAGPYAAFSSRLLAGSASLAKGPHIIQSVQTESHAIVFGGDTAYVYDDGAWDDVATLTPIENNPLKVPFNRRRWTSGYLRSGSYVSHYNYGVYRVESDASLTLLDDDAVAGLPEGVVAIAESNGRMLFLTDEAIYWSAPNDPENLTPSLGGAGFFDWRERIGGYALALTTGPTGLVIWTTKGALVGEFTGGSTVWRWYRLATQAFPLSAFAFDRYADESHLMLTALGLYRVVDGQPPEPLTPLFNEYLRTYLTSNPDLEAACWASYSENQLYISFRNNTHYFSSTYVLNLSLDKWGVFNPEHLGIIDYNVGRGGVGYADRDGIVHRFVPKASRFRQRELAKAPNTYTDLDSEIIIGQIRAPQLKSAADTLQEIQEIVVYRAEKMSAQGDTFVDESPAETMSEAVTLEVDESVDEDMEVAVTFAFDESADELVASAALYGIEVISDLFPNHLDGSPVTVPELAFRGIEQDTWTCITSSYYHQIRFTATELGEFYQIRGLDLTIGYIGHLS